MPTQKMMNFKRKRTFVKLVLSGDHGFRKVNVIGDYISFFYFLKWLKFYNCISILFYARGKQTSLEFIHNFRK